MASPESGMVFLDGTSVFIVGGWVGMGKAGVGKKYMGSMSARPLRI
jgi:hypothetical protein